MQSKALLSANPQEIAIDAGWSIGSRLFVYRVCGWRTFVKEGVKVVEFIAWTVLECGNGYRMS